MRMNRNALKRGIADQNHNFKAKMRLLIIIALFAETVVCNFRTWESIKHVFFKGRAI